MNSRPCLKSADLTIDQMIQIEKKIVRLQAIARGKITFARIAERALAMKRKCEIERGELKPELLAVREFVAQLTSKRVTPEAFFRMLDSTYAKCISKATFEQGVKDFGLRMSDTQVRRCCYIFDEDCNDTITLSEYQDALAAFNLARERHINVHGRDARNFQTRALETLFEALNNRRLSLNDLFDACDADGNDCIQLTELEQVIQNAKPSIQLKELHTIYEYLDLDKNGSISRSEFLQQLERPQRAANLRQERLTAGDIFEEEEAEMADQAGAPLASRSVPKGASMSPRTRSETALKQLKVEMTKYGVKATSVFTLGDKLKRGVAKRDDIKAAFGKIGGQLQPALVSEALLFFGKTNLEIKQAVFLAAFESEPTGSKSPQKRPSSARPVDTKIDEETKDQHIRKLAIAFRNEGISPAVAFKNADQNSNGVITIDELKTMLKRILPGLAPAEIMVVMKTFDKNRNGRIEEQEWCSTLDGFGVPSTPQPRPQTAVAQQPVQQKPQGLTPQDIQKMSLGEICDFVEKQTGRAIEKLFVEMADHEIITTRQIQETFRRATNKNIPNEVSLKLGYLINRNAKSEVSVWKLYKAIAELPGKSNAQQDMQRLFSKVPQEYEQTLRRDFAGEGDVNWSEFSQAMSNYCNLDTWALITVFNEIASPSPSGPEIKFQALVDLVYKTNGVPRKQGKVQVQAVTQKQQQQPAEVPRKQTVEAQAAQVDTGNTIIDTLSKHFKQKMASLDQEALTQAKENDPKILQFDRDPVKNGCKVDDQIVINFMKCLVLLQKVIVHDRKRIEHTINSLVAWHESFEGNGTEGAKMYLFRSFAKECALEKDIKETNALMARRAYSQATGSEFDLFDCIIISVLITSRDGFNDLEIDSEFSTQLAGVSEIDATELKDFVAVCQYRMKIRLHLAKLILCLDDQNPGVLQITRNQVYDKCRFAHISQQIQQALESNPAHQRMWQDRFDLTQKQLLTYYDFNKLLQAIGIVEYKSHDTEWMLEDFCSHLDKQNLAQIQYNEIYDWLSEAYNFKCGKPPRNKRDIDDTIKAQRDITPEDYQLTDKDYFRGVSTILTNERAAIKVCNKLFAETKERDWEDPDFGPGSKMDEDQRSERLAEALFYCVPEDRDERGLKRQPGVDHAMLDWIQPREMAQDEGESDEDSDDQARLDTSASAQEPKFIIGDASANDVRQGAFGDCWFIGALSVLATRDNLLRGCGEYVPKEMVDLVDASAANACSIGVFPPIFHRYREKGIYCLRFFKNEQWCYVIIDRRLCVWKDTKKRYLSSCKDIKELWVALIEKAYAKLFGCFEALTGGFIDQGLYDMTAMVPERRFLHDKQGLFNEDPNKFWAYLLEMRENGCLMGCSRSGKVTEGEYHNDNGPTGILQLHAYGIMDVFEIPCQDKSKFEGKTDHESKPRITHRLLRVRNPWGRQEWCGPWSSNSDEIEDNRGALESYIEGLEEEERFDLDNDQDGTFLINYKNWREIYNKFFAVHDFPDEYNAVEFNSRWTQDCDGGIPKTAKDYEKFASNPQYLFEHESQEESIDLFISLQQNDGRIGKGDQRKELIYDTYPFRENNTAMFMQVYEVARDCKRVPKFDKNSFKVVIPERGMDISVRFQAKRNQRYIVVVAKTDADKLDVDFRLKFYFNAEVHECNIQRVGNINERYQFVPAESEKFNQLCPDWKIDLVKNSAEYFFAKDDKAVNRSKTLRRKTTTFKDHSLDTSLNKGATKARRSTIGRRTGNKMRKKAARAAQE